MIFARRRTSRVVPLSALTLVSGFSLAAGLGCSANQNPHTFGTGGDAPSGAQA